jgi:hypothetical protein
MKRLWIGVVEALAGPSTLEGNTCALTNVVAGAKTESDYVASLMKVFENYGWTVLGVENGRPIDSVEGCSEEIADIIERAKANPLACIYSTFFSSPSRPN